MLSWLGMVLAAWVLAGPSGPVLAAETREPPTYLIGPGDALAITVWRQSELSTGVIVRPDGRISIPLVEDLMAAGKTPMDLADEIEDRLAEYLKDPMVTVAAGGLGDLSQQVRVLGEATTPSALPYRSGMTALDAVIATGGLSRQADGNGAVIVRQTEAGSERIPVRLADLVRNGDSSANVPLLPGDVIIIPEGFFDGEWHITYSASASETFSDNIDQNPSGDRKPGLVTRAGPNFSIAGETARVQAAFSGSLAGVFQIGGDDEGFSVDPSIAGTSTTELVQDHVFFDLDTSVKRRLLDARQSTSASGASTSNRDVVATLTASPYLVHRLGDFADAEWRYSFSPVLVNSNNSSNSDSGDANDVFSHDGSFILSSGQDFSRFGWTWTNRVGQEVRSQESDIKSASTDFAVAYPLWREFSLIGATGYEYRDGDTDEEDNFDGITWRGGFHWTPSPDMDLQATYGRQDNEDSLDASLNYQVGPKTSVKASYSEALETSQQRAISDLSNLTRDPVTGELVDETGDPFSFNNGTTRTRTLRVGATHNEGRDTFGLSGTAGTSDGESEDDEEFYEGRLTWSRPLNTEMNFTSSAGYEHSIFEDEDRTDDTYNLNMGLSYRLAPDARASVSYSFEVQDSTDSDNSYYENAVTVGITFAF